MSRITKREKLTKRKINEKRKLNLANREFMRRRKEPLGPCYLKTSQPRQFADVSSARVTKSQITSRVTIRQSIWLRTL